MKKILCIVWTHPEWDMALVLRADGKEGSPETFLSDDADPLKLEVEEVILMTNAELADLPEFEG
jgi:hypothetical protein